MTSGLMAQGDGHIKVVQSIIFCKFLKKSSITQASSNQLLIV